MKTSKNATLLKMPKRHATSPIAVESRTLFLRHQRVILDVDLAQLYGVTVKRLNQQGYAQSRAIPLRLHVSTQFTRARIFEVAICNLKQKPRWPPLPTA